MIAKTWQLSLITGSMLILGGCMPNHIVRNQDHAGAEIFQGTVVQCPADAWQVVQSEQSEQVTQAHLGFVEFDDQGALHNRALARSVTDKIRKLSEDAPLLVIVFAHGWKHSARAQDSNVRDFAEMLLRVVKEDKEACAGAACEGRKVVGLYVGWRGLSARVEPFKELSFWTRKSRAERIGLDGAMEVIADLKKIDAGNPNNKLILVGHSFGSALLYTAIQQQLMRDTAFLKSGSIAREAADLIILVNPAIEASRFDSLHSRAAEMTHSDTQKPILAIFTSKGDTATGKAFPLGRTVGTLFQSHVSSEQKAKNRTAIGHYGSFITHDLLPARADAQPHEVLVLPAYQEYGCAWQRYQHGVTDSWDLNGLSLVRRPGMQTEGQRRNPYYNVSVDESIINGHNGIWGLHFSQFIYRFIAVQSWRDKASCR